MISNEEYWAHTPNSIDELISNFIKLSIKKGILIFGAITGKKIENMAQILYQYFKHIIISKPDNYKKSSTGKVYKIQY